MVPSCISSLAAYAAYCLVYAREIPSQEDIKEDCRKHFTDGKIEEIAKKSWDLLQEILSICLTTNPMEVAKQRGKEQILRLLQLHPIDFNQNIEVLTVCQIAQEENEDTGLEIIQDLVKEFGEEIIHKQDRRGWMPLHHAIKGGNWQMVKYLQDLGADINCKNVAGGTVLHDSILHEESCECIRDFICSGMDLSIEDNQGRTAFDCALEKKNLDVAYLLYISLDEIERKKEKEKAISCWQNSSSELVGKEEILRFLYSLTVPVFSKKRKRENDFSLSEVFADK